MSACHHRVPHMPLHVFLPRSHSVSGEQHRTGRISAEIFTAEHPPRCGGAVPWELKQSVPRDSHQGPGSSTTYKSQDSLESHGVHKSPSPSETSSHGCWREEIQLSFLQTVQEALRCGTGSPEDVAPVSGLCVETGFQGCSHL